MPLQGNGLCTAGHRLNSVHYFCQPFIGADLSPRHRELIPKPGPLPFGELARANFDQLDRISQVALALQLPFAMLPLLHFTSSRKRMGRWKNGWLLLVAGWSSALLITAMDVYGLPESLKSAWRVITGGQ